MLPANFEPKFFATKFAPQEGLWQAHSPPQLPRKVDFRFTQRRAPTTSRFANGPPPPTGEDHFPFSSHAPQAAFARSRTRPM
jgi:hypothetical protein